MVPFRQPPALPSLVPCPAPISPPTSSKSTPTRSTPRWCGCSIPRAPGALVSGPNPEWIYIAGLVGHFGIVCHNPMRSTSWYVPSMSTSLRNTPSTTKPSSSFSLTFRMSVSRVLR